MTMTHHTAGHAHDRKRWLALMVLCLGVPVRAQTVPDTPIVFGDGRVTLGGDVTWSIGPKDRGFFNYTDYAHSALRIPGTTGISWLSRGSAARL